MSRIHCSKQGWNSDSEVGTQLALSWQFFDWYLDGNCHEWTAQGDACTLKQFENLETLLVVNADEDRKCCGRFFESRSENHRRVTHYVGPKSSQTDGTVWMHDTMQAKCVREEIIKVTYKDGVDNYEEKGEAYDGLYESEKVVFGPDNWERTEDDVFVDPEERPDENGEWYSKKERRCREAAHRCMWWLGWKEELDCHVVPRSLEGIPDVIPCKIVREKILS